MGFYFFDRKKVNKKLFAKISLYGVSIRVSALITHFGGVLSGVMALKNFKKYLLGNYSADAIGISFRRFTLIASFH